MRSWRMKRPPCNSRAPFKKTGGSISIGSALSDNLFTRWWTQVTREIDAGGSDVPWRIGARAWARIVARSLNGAISDDFGIFASSIAFAAFLSILPLMSLVAVTYGMAVPDTVVATNVGTFVAILPQGAQALVQSWLTNSLTRHNGGIIALVVSAAITLFGARRAGRSLLHGLNVATGIPQDRGPIAGALVSLVVVAAAAGLMLAALVAISALALIKGLVPTGLPGASSIFQLILWGSLTLGSAAVLTLTYRYAAASAPIPWLWSAPGALLAVLLWIGATSAFRYYVSQIANYASTYGSLSAVIVLLLWLMMSAYILLFGAKLNAEAMAAAGLR